MVEVPEANGWLHRHAAGPFLALRRAAAAGGLELRVASSFRDFERQRGIWNAKFFGERPVLDRRGQVVDVMALDERRRVLALLVWSALPGASRHHWGTDVDVVEGKAVIAGHRPRLIPSEYRRGGAFYPLTCWLDQNMRRFGFFRPYQQAGQGVQPEPWHLSFAPVARLALKALTPELLVSTIKGRGVEGEAAILELMPQIHQRYVCGISMPPRMRSRYAQIS